MKQVIVVRKDLGMRAGKIVAQGAHASLLSFLRSGDPERVKWSRDGSTKICVRVDSETELHDLAQQAQQARLPFAIIQDAGRTEFKEPTYTALCIGPAPSEKIDKITGHLKLL